MLSSLCRGALRLPASSLRTQSTKLNNRKYLSTDMTATYNVSGSFKVSHKRNEQYQNAFFMSNEQFQHFCFLTFGN